MWVGASSLRGSREFPLAGRRHPAPAQVAHLTLEIPMKVRVLALVLLLPLALACASEPAEAPETTEPAAEAPMNDEAAVDAVRVAYVERHNAGDVDGVAGLFTDDAVALFADGGVNMGRDAIRANFETTMAGAPSATIDAAETMVFGDHAVQRGSYRIEMTPEGGETTGFGGHYLTEFTRTAGDWKISALIANYDGPAPAGMPAGTMPEEPAPPLADDPLADFTAAYEEHFNQGHASVVGEMFTEDAAVAYAGVPLVTGREAITDALQQRMDAGAQLAIHPVAMRDLGAGWYVQGGWYESTAEGVTRPGNWISLVTTAEDGSHRLHWVVTNIVPDGM